MSKNRVSSAFVTQRHPAASSRQPVAADRDVAGITNSPRMLTQRKLIDQIFGPVAQRQDADEEEPAQAKSHGATAQRQEDGGQDEDEEPAQLQRRRSEPGHDLPAQLMAGIEALSGMDMSDVQVHRNSGRPAQLNALAYAQGNDIHLAPGQEAHLPHEAWHVVQQRQGRVAPTMQLAGAAINDDASLEDEADAMGAKALQMVAGPPVHGASTSAGPAASAPVQRRVGLEIEIAVPVDDLTAPQTLALSNYVTARPAPTALEIAHAQSLADAGRIDTMTHVMPGGGGFHVDTDHDDRVRTPPGIWPPREAADGILEIVMDPAVETTAELNTTMNNIQTWINTLMAQTNNLTTRWHIGGGGGAGGGVGPLYLPAYGGAGLAATRRPNHNFQGSIQANVGVDLREYHSMLKWYAKSKYAPKKRSTDAPVIKNQKDDMLRAVVIGRAATEHIRNVGFPPVTAPLTALQVQAMGNLRGLRGWLTHAALALLRGAYIWGIQGSNKNIVPVLLKSTNDLVLQHGLTAAELAYYTNNKADIVAHMLAATNRLAVDGHYGDTVFKIGGIGHHPNWSIAELFDENLNDSALIAPANQKAPSDVGPARTGNAQVQAIADAPVIAGLGGGVGRRAGMVLEFRTVEGLHNGVNAWKKVAKAFLKAADKRNTRDGLDT